RRHRTYRTKVGLTIPFQSYTIPTSLSEETAYCCDHSFLARTKTGSWGHALRVLLFPELTVTIRGIGRFGGT
ncbi:MAG: hypothetical protein V1792_22050, partial [Pseudomonadota bacterium]